jgi:hypothetical protein
MASDTRVLIAVEVSSSQTIRCAFHDFWCTYWCNDFISGISGPWGFSGTFAMTGCKKALTVFRACLSVHTNLRTVAWISAHFILRSVTKICQCICNLLKFYNCTKHFCMNTWRAFVCVCESWVLLACTALHIKQRPLPTRCRKKWSRFYRSCCEITWQSKYARIMQYIHFLICCFIQEYGLV